METLVAVAHHRNQYYSGNSRKGNNSSIMFDSSRFSQFTEVNCRAFEAGIGLLPSPGSNHGFLSPTKRISGFGFGRECKSEDVKKLKRFIKSSPIAIDFKRGGVKERENLVFSELWAGPAYSNSPPPSSLPMPKFEMKPKRTVSLELPRFESDLVLPVFAKSAPSSPTGNNSRDFFSDDDDFATKTLRRILNLDNIDD